MEITIYGSSVREQGSENKITTFSFNPVRGYDPARFPTGGESLVTEVNEEDRWTISVARDAHFDGGMDAKKRFLNWKLGTQYEKSMAGQIMMFAKSEDHGFAIKSGPAFA